MTERALFDPGFTPYVYSFSNNIQAVNSLLHGIKTPTQRKFRFQMLKSQIYSLIENNIAFYFGCLLWAKYLKETMPDKEIENNPFYGIDLKKEKISDEQICQEINKIIEYLKQYPKDCKFYLGKEYYLPEAWSIIANTYKEFLLINNSFVNTKLCKDIKLPVNISEIVKRNNSENKLLIEKAINQKNMAILLT